MVNLALWIKAEMENVTDLMPADDFTYFFQVVCNSCHETHPKFVSLNRHEEHDVPGTRNAKAHFVWRCSNCKRESTAKFLDAPKAYTADANGNFAPHITVECRGLEFTGFDPMGTWSCKGAETVTKFEEFELEDGEWVDYDEKASLPVGVSKIESDFRIKR